MLRSLADSDALLRFSLLAIFTGLVAGLGAAVFRALIAFFHNLLFLGVFSLSYDANTHTPASPWGVAVILVPVLGALAVTYLVKHYAPEAKGHGVPEVIDAIYYHGGVIRPTVAVIKSLASAISIGSGGAIGREGPIIQIGAAFGSTVGQLIPLPRWQRLTLIACGAGGGIAATFNTPIGGLLFAIELILPEISSRTLIPVALATGAATYAGRGQYPRDMQGKGGDGKGREVAEEEAADIGGGGGGDRHGDEGAGAHLEHHDLDGEEHAAHRRIECGRDAARCACGDHRHALPDGDAE